MDSDVSSKGDEAKEVCAEDVEATPAADLRSCLSVRSRMPMPSLMKTRSRIGP
jgi:hypothetical protein